MNLTKTKRYRNKKYLAAAKGQSCTLRFAGCNYQNETTVAAHENGAGTGMKAGDDSIAFSCSFCHLVYDDKELPHDYPRPNAERRAKKFEAGRTLTHIKLCEMGLMKKSDIGRVK